MGWNFGFYVAVCQGQRGWSIPAGRVEATDQDPLQAALKEFGEETNGYLDKRELTHMGIITRRAREGDLARSLVFRAKVDLYHFGIDHEIEPDRIVQIGGDEEATFITFRAIDRMLPAPIYRPDINIPVVRAFSQIED